MYFCTKNKYELRSLSYNWFLAQIEKYTSGQLPSISFYIYLCDKIFTFMYKKLTVFDRCTFKFSFWDRFYNIIHSFIILFPLAFVRDVCVFWDFVSYLCQLSLYSTILRDFRCVQSILYVYIGRIYLYIDDPPSLHSAF